ncbi:MAG: hypothetical protein ABIK76_06355, partial [candidate division WOR-3 bacterium]
RKENGEKDGPFCTRCWDKNKDLIRMHPCGNPAYSECPECKNSVKTGPDTRWERNLYEDSYEY